MKTIRALFLAAAALSVVLPAASLAQRAGANRTQDAHPHRFMKAFRSLGLTDAQKTQMKNLIGQFRQSHPKGSRPDKEARQHLREQLLNVLTPQQQSELKSELHATPSPESTAQP